MSESVKYEVREPVAWATLNRPDVLNAINDDMLQALLKIVRDVAADSRVRVLVLTGAGRAFSAGGDIKAMHGMTEQTFRETIRQYQQLSQATRDLDKPVLAAVNGYAMGGGFELALICDLRVASLSAKFGLPDIHLGLSPTSGMTYLLTRAIGASRAMNLALTNETIDAREAERIGLVTRVVADEALLDTVGGLAREIAARPALGLAYTKRGFYKAEESDFAAALAQEEEYEVACFRSEVTQRAFAAFLARKQRRGS